MMLMSYKEIKIFPLGIGVKEISKRSKLGGLSVHFNVIRPFKEHFLVVFDFLVLVFYFKDGCFKANLLLCWYADA